MLLLQIKFRHCFFSEFLTKSFPVSNIFILINYGGEQALADPNQDSLHQNIHCMLDMK